jgi:hypothetical protein
VCVCVCVCVLGIHEIRSPKLFTQAVFKLSSSSSLSPKGLGLQMWAPAPSLVSSTIYFKSAARDSIWNQKPFVLFKICLHVILVIIQITIII